MNRRIYIVIVGLLALLGGANAQTLSVGTIEGKVGEQATLTVSLTDAASATALQFNLSLPANVTVNESGCALGNAATNHTLSVNKMDNGDYLFVMYSMDFTALVDGTLLTIPVTIGNDATTGNGNLNTVRSAKSDAVSQQHQNVTFGVTITSSTIVGDVNGDGEVNVGDIVTVCNVMAGISTVDPQLADVNNDGEVNVGDIVTICNIMAGKE